jgi:hypothetical protein
LRAYVYVCVLYLYTHLFVVMQSLIRAQRDRHF